MTNAMTVTKLLRGQLRFMRSQGLDVTVICNPAPELDEVAHREDVRCVGVAMRREIAPLADMHSLARLVGTLRTLRPDIVNASTPKGALLGMLAARAARVPTRIYVMRGLRSETATGAKKTLLQATELATARQAHQIVCVSESLRQRWIARPGAQSERTTVLGGGSSNGVDAERFAPAASPAEVRAARRDLGLCTRGAVIGFVGRLTRDKGIGDLYEAFTIVRQTHRDAQLLLVGDLETGDPLDARLLSKLRSDPAVVMPGGVADPARCYHAMTVLAFPSYREGFPNVPLEAAASGVAAVGYAATGTVDAIAAGHTGHLVPIGAIGNLAQSVSELIVDEELRARYGRAARERVLREFSSEIIWANLAAMYRHQLSAA